MHTHDVETCLSLFIESFLKQTTRSHEIGTVQFIFYMKSIQLLFYDLLNGDGMVYANPALRLSPTVVQFIIAQLAQIKQ